MPQADRQSTTRRALFAAAPAVAIAATLPAAAVAHDAKAARWKEIEAFANYNQATELAPQVALAVHRAKFAGLDPDDFSGVYVSGIRDDEKKKVWLHFYDWERDKKLVTVTHDQVLRHYPEA